MADAIQPATRNLYQKKFAFLEYRDGAGHSYAEQIRLQSWPNNEDVSRRVSSGSGARRGRPSTTCRRGRDMPRRPPALPPSKAI